MDTAQMNHITSQLTTEADVQAVRDLLRDLQEIIVGVQRSATKALDALEEGDWQSAVHEMERLAVIR